MVITSSSAAPLVIVMNATGNLGGSVLRHLAHSRSPYRVRGLTRDANKPSAQEIVRLGAEAYAVQLGADKTDTTVKAFEGSDVVFGHTLDTDNSVAEGKSIVDAAKKAGVKLFVWSGLPSFKAISHGKYVNVNMFDDKADVTVYARQELGRSSVIDVQPPGFFSNFFTVHRPVKLPDGTYKVSLPVRGDVKGAWLDAQRDYGAYVVAAMELSPKERPQEVVATSELLSFDETVKIISAATGKTVTFEYMSPEAYESSIGAFVPPPLVKGLSEMWQTISEFGYFGKTKPTTLAELQSQYEPRSFQRWAQETDWTTTLD